MNKLSQDAESKTYKFIPLQEFTKKSDIDWNQSIEDLNSQLYEKYNITSEEAEYKFLIKKICFCIIKLYSKFVKH